MSPHRSGTIAIIGRPNVGKSTLLNCLIGEKLSIVSKKAQTTRHKILGILTQGDTQYLFVDTPGFQNEHQNALSRIMNRSVKDALSDVDVVLFVIEAHALTAKDRLLLPLLPEKRPVILVINKIDELKDEAEKAVLFQRLPELSQTFSFAAIVPVSAEKNKQIDALLSEITPHLKTEGWMFSEDDFTDRSERFLASEYLREKLFHFLGDELPYHMAVEIEKFETEGNLRRIHAAIFVDKEAHKGIVIGKAGANLKRIASTARADMEKGFGGKVFLEVFVKVKSGWSEDERLLKSLGYES